MTQRFRCYLIVVLIECDYIWESIQNQALPVFSAETNT